MKIIIIIYLQVKNFINLKLTMIKIHTITRLLSLILINENFKTNKLDYQTTYHNNTSFIAYRYGYNEKIKELTILN
jgi:hypothetical protein